MRPTVFEKVICMSVYEDKHTLFRMYVSELEAVADVKLFRSEKELRQAVDNYINSDARWINVHAKNKDLAGFLIICKNPDRYEHTDYLIAHAYIDPKYRGQKLMADCLDDRLARHGGVYCMPVYGNDPGIRRFWEHYFLDRAGYRRANLRSTSGQGEDNTILLAFRPKKKSKTVDK